MLTAIINGFATWAKLRPAMSQLIVGTFESWTPNSLQGLSASAVKSVEKSIRILLMHLARCATSHSMPSSFTTYNESLGRLLIMLLFPRSTMF